MVYSGIHIDVCTRYMIFNYQSISFSHRFNRLISLGCRCNSVFFHFGLRFCKYAPRIWYMGFDKGRTLTSNHHWSLRSLESSNWSKACGRTGTSATPDSASWSATSSWRSATPREPGPGPETADLSGQDGEPRPYRAFSFAKTPDQRPFKELSRHGRAAGFREFALVTCRRATAKHANEMKQQDPPLR